MPSLLRPPPRCGKTVLLYQIGAAISANHPNIKRMALVVDERPEEVTNLRRAFRGAEVYASSLDRDVANHVRLGQLTIERAKRLAEEGHDVFVVMDSITRMARAPWDYPGSRMWAIRPLPGRYDRSKRAWRLLLAMVVAGRADNEFPSRNVGASHAIRRLSLYVDSYVRANALTKRPRSTLTSRNRDRKRLGLTGATLWTSVERFRGSSHLLIESFRVCLSAQRRSVGHDRCRSGSHPKADCVA